MARFLSPRISMLHFADEIELVPFDQPLQIPQGMSPIPRAQSPVNGHSNTPTAGVLTSAADIELTSDVHGYSTRLRRHPLPLFHPAA